MTPREFREQVDALYRQLETKDLVEAGEYLGDMLRGADYRISTSCLVSQLRWEAWALVSVHSGLPHGDLGDNPRWDTDGGRWEWAAAAEWLRQWQLGEVEPTAGNNRPLSVRDFECLERAVELFKLADLIAAESRL